MGCEDFEGFSIGSDKGNCRDYNGIEGVELFRASGLQSFTAEGRELWFDPGIQKTMV